LPLLGPVAVGGADVPPRPARADPWERRPVRMTDWATADDTEGVAAETPLRLLVADRSLAFAEALSQLLRDRHGVVAVAAPVEAAPAEASELRPSVVLLDGDQPVGIVREAVLALQDAVP